MGKNLYGLDTVWKWAPDGNDKHQNLTLSAEYLRASNISDMPSDKDSQEGWYLSSVYQLAPQWSTGLRHGQFSGLNNNYSNHSEIFLKETEVMVSWSYFHFSTIRLQFTRQQDERFEHTLNDIVTIQFVMALGAHHAH